MNVSFHNHSEYSWDCLITLEALEKQCGAQGIDAITITDHNEIKGAQLAASRFTKVQVIIGEEINTSEGEVVGIFLKERIEPGLSFKETVAEIHRQGGLAIIVHPFDRLRSHVIDNQVLQEQIASIDAIEIFNSRTVFGADNDKALAFAREHNKPVIVGNDAHTLGEIGLSSNKMGQFTNAREFLTALDKAELITKRAPVWVHAITKVVKWTHRYRGK